MWKWLCLVLLQTKLGFCLPVRHPPRDTTATLPAWRSGGTAGMQQRSENLSTSPSEACGFGLNRTSSGRCGSEEGSNSDVPLSVQRARSDSQVRKEHAERNRCPVATRVTRFLSFRRTVKAKRKSTYTGAPSSSTPRISVVVEARGARCSRLPLTGGGCTGRAGACSWSRRREGEGGCAKMLSSVRASKFLKVHQG